MYSVSPVRSSKRRRDEIDDKIGAIANVINTMTGPEKTLLQAKLSNLKLKSRKLIALSLCRSHSDPLKQSLVAEFDMMIAENDIDIEIESIRSSKKFKRTEKSYLEGLFQDPYDGENIVYNSTPKETSTYDTCTEVKTRNEYNCRENVSNTQSRVPMCNKSTNTEPICILSVLDANEMLPANTSISSAVYLSPSSIFHSEDNLCPIDKNKTPNISTVISENTFPIEKSLSEENVNPMEQTQLSTQENVLQSKENTFHVSEQGMIQSRWFESSFEVEHLFNEPLPHLEKNSSTSKTTENVYKHKSYQRRSTKNKKSKQSSDSYKNIVTARNLVVDRCDTTLPTENSPDKENTEYTKDLALPAATAVLPEALPEVNHRNIVNLFKTYKNIYASEKISKTFEQTKNQIPAENPINKGDDDKLQADTKGFKTPAKYDENSIKKSDCKENHQNIKGIQQQIAKFSTIPKPKKAKKPRNSKHIQTINAPEKFTEPYESKFKDLLTESQHIYAKSQGMSAESKATTKYQDLSTMPHQLSVKSQNFPDLPTESQDLPTKSQALPTKPQDLPTKSQDIPTKPQDLPTKSQALPTKSQALPTKSQALPTVPQDIPTKSKDLPSNSNKTTSTKIGHKRTRKEIENVKDHISNISNEKKEVLYMTLFKKAMETYGEFAHY